MLLIAAAVSLGSGCGGPGDTHEEPAPQTYTYDGEMQELLRYYCAPCHAGDAFSGGTNFVTVYESLFQPALLYPKCIAAGMNISECNVLRSADYSMPSDAGLVAPIDLEKFEIWVAEGSPR